jgi:uncharacterized membrane protein YkoI
MQRKEVKNMNKRKIMPVAVLTLLLAGAVGIVQLNPVTVRAQSVAPSVSQNAAVQPAASTADPDTADKQEPSYTSSVKAPAETSGTEVNEATEAQQLQGLAKITPEQAKAAAEKSAGGTASAVKLEDENGNVVYAVTVGQKEVKVDAGNATVLHTEAADAAETGKPEAN